MRRQGGKTIMTESTIPEQEKKTDELKPAGEGRILELPILPLRNTVIFPSGISPLTVGRPLSLAAAEAALATEEKLLGVVAQRTDGDGDPTTSNLYQVGTMVVINRMMRSPGSEDTLHLIVQGQERFRILGFTEQTPY